VLLPNTARTLWIAATAALFAVLTAPAWSQEQEDANARLEAVEREIEARRAAQAELEKRAQTATTEAERLSLQLVSIGRDIRLSENNAKRLEARIDALETEEANKETELATRQDELLELLSALERLSKRPAALALLQPNKALKTAQSASLMGTIVPNINAKAADLRKDLSALEIIQTRLSNQRFQLKNTLERLTEHQLKVGSLVTRRQAEAKKAASGAQNARQELARFAREAASLRELIDKLAQQAAKLATAEANRVERPLEAAPIFRPSGRPIAEMKGALPYPVSGRLVTRFGAKETVGEARGIRIESRPGAQVVAPYDGKIVFAGPFREYGQLLIIEHGDGYHSLMAGFGQLYGTVGQWVLTGEPIGVMTAQKSANQLYVEMRRQGQAINPVPWLSSQFASLN
jgi:septal ring factor EnvC (AmiA/AmiB activator)